MEDKPEDNLTKEDMWELCSGVSWQGEAYCSEEAKQHMIKEGAPEHWFTKIDGKTGLPITESEDGSL